MLKSRQNRQSFCDKKCAGASISWTKPERELCQQSVKSYFNFNLELLVRGSRVRNFHYGREKGLEKTPP